MARKRSPIRAMMATVAVAAMVLTGAPAVGQPGRTAATANWPLFHDNGAATGFNPNETVLGVSNVPSLVLRWRATEDYRKVLGYTPVVAQGIAYVAGETGDSSSLYAFDAAGMTNCTGTPDRCTPLWIGTTIHGSGVVTSAPAVGSKFAYIVQDNGTVSAFRASGCGAATCTAIWTGSTGSSTLDASPVVVGGVLYVGTFAGSLSAFDAAGQTNCSGAPRVCAPLWTGQTGGPIEGSVAVSRGVAYVGSGDGDLYAFDAAGQTNCSGTPVVCAPLWTGSTGGSMQFGASPAVANGLVYVGSGDSSLYAFDAAGILNCSGDPKSCSPLWTAPTGGSITSTPAVAGGVLYHDPPERDDHPDGDRHLLLPGPPAEHGHGLCLGVFAHRLVRGGDPGPRHGLFAGVGQDQPGHARYLAAALDRYPEPHGERRIWHEAVRLRRPRAGIGVQLHVHRCRCLQGAG